MLKSFFLQLKNSTFLRHNAVFFVGSVAIGALNYFYYPIIGRLLPPEGFGEVQALVSLFLQLTIFLNVLSMITVTVVTNYKNRAEAHAVVFELEKLALLVSLVGFGLVAVMAEPLKQAFHFTSGWPFLLIALAVVVGVPMTFRGSYLRAIKKFGQTSIVGIIGAAGKLVFSTGLVFLGLGTAGAIGGIVAAQLVALGYAASKARRGGLIVKNISYFKLPNLQRLLPELKYAVLVFIGSFVITLLFSIDALVVKYLFDATTAGLYAGIATVARIIYFLTASVVLVLLPSVSLRHTRAQNRAVLFKSLALIFVLGVPTLLVCILFPEFMIGHLMGANYLAYAHLLPLLSVAIFIISLINLLLMYFIALHRRGVAIVAIIGAVTTFGLMAINHATLEAVVNDLLFGSLTMMIVLGVWLTITKPKSESKRTTSDTEAAHINHSAGPQ